MRQRRSDRNFILLLFVLGAMGVMTLFFGRAFFYMQQVGKFTETLHEKSSAQLRRELDRYAHALGDSNPMVRNAAVAAFRAATGEDFGNDTVAWQTWWQDNRQTWEYKPVPAEKPVNP